MILGVIEQSTQHKIDVINIGHLSWTEIFQPPPHGQVYSTRHILGFNVWNADPHPCGVWTNDNLRLKRANLTWLRQLLLDTRREQFITKCVDTKNGIDWYHWKPQHKIYLVVSTPLKNIKQLGWLFPIYRKLENVPNHQPEICLSLWISA